MKEERNYGKLLVRSGVLYCGRKCGVFTSLSDLGKRTKKEIIAILIKSGWRKTKEFGWICSRCKTSDESRISF